MSLITKSEVIAIAFTRTINESKIPAYLISSVEEKHIRPLLGDDFFEAVIAAPLSYSALVPYLKNIIANYVKFYILPDIYQEVTDMGINVTQGMNRQVSDKNGLEYTRQNTLDIAKMLINTCEKYLFDNQTSYPLYTSGSAAMNNIVIAGGIIFKKHEEFNSSDEEDEANDWL